MKVDERFPKASQVSKSGTVISVGRVLVSELYPEEIFGLMCTILQGTLDAEVNKDLMEGPNKCRTLLEQASESCFEFLEYLLEAKSQASKNNNLNIVKSVIEKTKNKDHKPPPSAN